MGITAAFFDIDGTLYREGLITATFKKLVKSDIIDQKRWYNEVKKKYDKWDKRRGNYDDYLLKIAEIYIDATVGLHKSQIEFIAKKVIEQNGDRVYKFTRDKIKWHKDMGHKVITISGSPEELVKEMSELHGFHDYIGTRYEKDDNDCFTGNITPMWDSKNKIRAIEDFVEKYDIDLSKSYAYGDTAGDYSMLSIIGHPTAVNPTKELLSKLKSNEEIAGKTNIVVERKDMVYRLDFTKVDF